MNTASQKKALIKDVTADIRASYEPEELQAFTSFEDFWAEVEVQNAYEEEWKDFKAKGIKAIYETIFAEIRHEKI